MEPAIGFAKDTVCCIFVKLYEQINHLRRLDGDVGEMQRLFDSVKAAKDDINNSLDLQGREALRVVKNWMDEVDKIERTVALHKGDYDLHKRCLFGCCPDCVFMLRLSSRVRDCIANLQKLSEEGKFQSLNGQFGEVPPATQLVPVAQLVGQTPQKAQAMIEGWLADNKTRVIGIYGIGGVGKTSLVQTINNNPNLNSRFGVVIFVAVSQNADVKTVQNSIAGRVGLSLPESDEERRRKLFNYLQQKRYLLILDNLWEKIDLDVLGVGVPSVGSGRKIVLTTRDRQVCMDMDADELLELKTLPPEEGWQLFRQKAHLADGKIPVAIESIARKLAEHCGGLPLAIYCIASAMRGKNDIRQWRLALDQRASMPDTFLGGLPDHLNSLKLSYDFLPQHLKHCFLDCALYRFHRAFDSFTSKNYYTLYAEDKVIDAEYDLIPKWIAEGLVPGTDRDDLNDIGNGLINVMRDRGLIETLDPVLKGRCEHVKVHDVLEDLAIQIGKTEKTCLYASDGNVIDFPFQEADIVGCQRISLVETGIALLPTDFKCHTLASLVLACNIRLTKIPEGFFINLPSLKVLELGGTNIESLPSSLARLKQLVYLNVSCTYIREFPESTGELTCLQFLNVCGCPRLTSLPSTISELKHLKILHLDRCHKLSILRREISLLTSLERLLMWQTGIFIGEGSTDIERNRISLKDLVKLTRLRVLRLQVKSSIVEGLMGSWINMTELWLDCTNNTNQEDLPKDMQVMKQLEVFQLENCNAARVPYWISEFQYLNSLHFMACHQLTALTELQSLPSLRTLVILGCDRLRALVVGDGSVGGFPRLEHLSLINLRSLETLVGPTLKDGAMKNLKQLMVRGCNGLTALPSGMEKLQNLQEIRGSQYWWESIVCEPDHVKNDLKKFYLEWAY